MFIAFLFSLSAITVVRSDLSINPTEASQDGVELKQNVRDLDIHATNEIPFKTSLPSLSEKNELNNDYLSPTSATLSTDFFSAQSQQIFDYKSANAVEKNNELCKSSDNEPCNSKTNYELLPSTKIPIPSQDLIPPFNDLEQELAFQTTTYELPTFETTKTRSEDNFPTTTERFSSSTTEKQKFLEPLPTQNFPFYTTAGKQIAESNKAEATNELKTYLPPQNELSSAAQTNIAVIQPSTQNNQDNSHDHDHHHGHHHGENFNICDDAFHAFLCAPLKARKRITGAFPTSLIGQSSYINYMKTLPNADKETAPSNIFRNEYLPPAPVGNLARPTGTSAFTAKAPVTVTSTSRPYVSPKITSKPTNANNRVYLPPSSNNILKLPKPAPSNQALSTAKSSTAPATFRPSSSNSLLQKTPALLSSSKSNLPIVPALNPLFSKDKKVYLPPIPSQPPLSFASTSDVSLKTSTFAPHSSSFLPFNSASEFGVNSIIISQKPIVQPTLPAFSTTTKPFSTASNPLPSASQPVVPSSSYLPSIPRFQYTPSSSTTKQSLTSLKFSETAQKQEKAYLPPDLKEPAAAQLSSTAVAPPRTKNPSHHGRDLCTDPFHSFLCASSKPRKIITGQLPKGSNPESSNTNESILKPSPSSSANVLGSSTQNEGYNYSKPINPVSASSNTQNSSTTLPVTGYSFSQPNIFPSENGKIAFATSPTKKPETVVSTSEAKTVNGYQYPKPNKVFPLPAGQGNSQIVSTTSAPTTGYSYSKPQKPFPLPSETKETQQNAVAKPSLSPQPSNEAKGYQYPKPQQSLNLPDKKGYSYPKPENRLELPTEGRSKFSLSQSSATIDPVKNLGSAEFIPVNKVEFKRAESSKLLTGLRTFGERMKMRQRQAFLIKKKPN